MIQGGGKRGRQGEDESRWLKLKTEILALEKEVAIMQEDDCDRVCDEWGWDNGWQGVMRGHRGWGFTIDSMRFREILPWFLGGHRG